MKKIQEKLKNWRVIFFPKNFYERYAHVGSYRYTKHGHNDRWKIPLILFIDYKMRPWWCPKWFLRLIAYLATDWSIVRVKNRFIYYKIYLAITRGFKFVEWKTKWTKYDLRLTVYGDDEISWLAMKLESAVYREGYREEMIEEIKKINPNMDVNHLSYDMVRDEYKRLKNE